MKIEVMKIYKCERCGCCFDNLKQCREHEDAHFDIKFVSLEDQHFIVGNLAPVEVILTGFAIKDSEPVFKDFIYTLKGEKDND